MIEFKWMKDYNIIRRDITRFGIISVIIMFITILIVFYPLLCMFIDASETRREIKRAFKDLFEK